MDNAISKSSCLIFAIIGISLCCAVPTSAQVIPDNTLGEENSVVNLRDGNSDTIEGGALRGQNLYHSFQEFNVDARRGVYFANPDNVTNIFSRVTGNNITNILGTLGVDGAADLYLINPNGIVFGEDARLDVKGSFFATTANSIEFRDNSFFSAIAPQSSVLTISVPLGLQFGATPGSIINRSFAVNPNGETNITGSSTGLQVPTGKTLGLLGGDIFLDDGNLTAKGGNIELASIKEEGKVALQQTNNNLQFDYGLIDSFGNIELVNSSVIDVAAENNGSINITGENITVERSLINAGIIGSSSNLNQAGDINLNARENILILGAGSGVNNSIFQNSVGNGGDINLSAKSLDVSQGAKINANIFGQGNTGNVNIRVDETVIITDPNSWITSQISSGGMGVGGNISLIADNLTLQNGGQLFTGTFGNGNAGNVNIAVADTLRLREGAGLGTQVNSVAARGNSGELNIETGTLSIENDSFISSSSLGQGNANDINIQATESIEVIGIGSGILSQVGESGIGNAGSINLETNNLVIRDTGQISASNLGQGNANDVNIQATESIEIVDSGSQISSNINFGGTGSSGNINLTTSELTLNNSGLISAASLIGSNGGNIDLNVDTLKIDNGSTISTFSGIISDLESDLGTGNAGELRIKATESIEISGQNSALLTSFLGLGSSGNISLQTQKLSLKDGGLVASSAVDFAGIFDVIPDDFDLTLLVNLINLDPTLDRTAVEFINSIINGDLEANIEQGDSGDIFIEATESLTIVNGEGILTSGTGRASGGNISISTPNLKLQQGIINTGTAGVADSGTINIFDAESVEVINGRLSSGTAINSQGNGGKLNIFTQELLIKEGGQISTSTFGSGDAGNLNITATDVVNVSGVNMNQARSRIIAQVEATNATGNGGNLTINTPQLFIDGGVISVTTFGQGNAGNLDINVAEAININGLNSGIGALVREEATGNGGNINLSTKELNLYNGALVTSRSFGLGNSGNLSLDILNTVTINNSNITTAAEQSSGGEITIKATDIFLKNESDISTFVLNGVSGGGNINLKADSIIAFDDSDIFAFAENGQGGNIILDTPAFFAEGFTLNSLISNPETLNNNNRADVNATGAVSGAVSIPDVSFIQNSLNELPDNSINTNELVANSCVSPAGNRQQGRFIITGGDSLPVRPGNADISNFSTGEVRHVPERNNSWQRGEPIVEPQGVYRLANGKLVLSRECPNSK
ncbi:MAG: filamentous hemagglutinin N-terminal domain-containing protein [Pleurocapsa sp. MO_192.B19]|nr:filamentous hemagglutinin N-terminal domain-containing protein [Pleurocapsa sp. MO_192.B19]